MNDDKEAVLAGFATMALDNDWRRLTTNARWISPETAFVRSREDSTASSDVYSFAMTCLEVGYPFVLANATERCVLVDDRGRPVCLRAFRCKYLADDQARRSAG